MLTRTGRHAAAEALVTRRSPTRRASFATVPAVPAGSSEDDQYLALAALLLSADNLGAEKPGDDLATLRRKRFEEHALAKSRHPSSRVKRSA